MIGFRKGRKSVRVIQYIKRKTVMFLVNKLLVGTKPRYFEVKRRLLNAMGHSIGEGTKIVGPIETYTRLTIGRDCWIGKNLRVNGNGTVVIGDCCDIAPEVTFQTGGHEIGGPDRRAGIGLICNQVISNGVWIGGRSTIIGNVTISDGSVVAGCACVVRDVPPNVLVGGVPAKIIRSLDK